MLVKLVEYTKLVLYIVHKYVSRGIGVTSFQRGYDPPLLFLFANSSWEKLPFVPSRSRGQWRLLNYTFSRNRNSRFPSYRYCSVSFALSTSYFLIVMRFGEQMRSREMRELGEFLRLDCISSQIWKDRSLRPLGWLRTFAGVYLDPLECLLLLWGLWEMSRMLFSLPNSIVFLIKFWGFCYN